MKVILCECIGPQWLVMAQELVQLGCVIDWWTGSGGQAKAIGTAFPNTIYQHNLEAIRGLPPVGWVPERSEQLDAELKELLAPCQVVSMQMMDRMDPTGAAFPHAERDRHFNRLAAFWLTVLKQRKPDVVVFSISPHLVFDYILYELCKIEGIPTLMFERTAFPERLLLLRSYEEGVVTLQARLERLRSARPEECPLLASNIRQSWERVRGTGEAAMPPNFQRKLVRTGLAGRLGENAYRLIPMAVIMLRHLMSGVRKQFTGQKAVPNYFKLPGKPMARSWVSPLGFALYKVKGILQKRSLWTRYHQLAIEPDIERPFLFFALHYQPERATAPLAGLLGDQILILELLARHLPKGWRILVKEHPWQLQPMSRGELSRPSWFYDEIAAIPGVELVPLSYTSEALIRKARAVVTATGSAGWEALCRGIPVLLFGRSWYASCPGVFHVSTEEDCRTGLDAIARGETPSEEDVLTFLLAIQELTVSGFLEPDLEVTNLSEKDAGSSMAEALFKAMQKLTGPMADSETRTALEDAP